MGNDWEGRFWAKVDKRGPDECWNWMGGTVKGGYGQLHENGRCKQAHRVSYELHHGAIEAGLCVLHTCDNPPCCNPAHLFKGTNADNMRDKAKKRRAPRFYGSRNPMTKLTDADVAAILESSEDPKVLAVKYSVTKRYVYKILAGIRYSSLNTSS